MHDPDGGSDPGYVNHQGSAARQGRRTVVSFGGPSRRFIALRAYGMTLQRVSHDKPRTTIAKILTRLRGPRPAARETIEVDLSWFASVASSVLAEQRREATSMLAGIEPFLDAFHRDVAVTLDIERGSLRLGFPCGSVWRFAVDDVESAAQIAAGARLGGLLLRLTHAGEGLVRIHGVWGRLSYVLCGLPVRDAFSA